MGKFYLMPDGAIATQENKPVLLTQEEFEVCCCGRGEVIISYDWSATSMKDLDTCTEVFHGTVDEQKVGWTIGYQTKYLNLTTRDNTGTSTYERVVFLARKSMSDGVWSNNTTIICKAGWYIPAGGSGSAKLTVKYNGVTQSITISPGSQSALASTLVATLTVTEEEVIIQGI